MFSREEVLKIAALARIELSEKEIERFGTELSAILDFVGTLNEVETRGVEPMSGGTRLNTIMREDGIVHDRLEGEGEELVQAAPKKKSGFIEVKSVFE